MEQVEKRRLTIILHTILTIALSAGTVLLLVGLIVGWRKPTVAAAMTIIFSLGALITTRRGYLTIPGIITPLMAWGLAVYTAGTADGIRDQGMFVLPIAIVAAGLLLGKRGILFLSLLSLATVTGMGWAEMAGILVTGISPGVTWEDVFFLDGLLVLWSALFYITIDYLTTSLTQTRQSERQLLATQRDLQTSEVRYRTLVENLGEGICLVDPQMCFTFANPELESIFGQTSGRLVGRNLREFTSPEQFARLQAQAQIRKSGGKSTYEIEVLRPSGVRRMLSVTATPHYDAAGQFAGSFAIVRDVTERRNAEITLRKLSRAVESSPASIVITDAHGTIEYVNPHFTQVTGYTLEEATGKNPRILKSGLTAPETYQDLWKTITSGNEWHGELVNRKKNGELYWEDVTIAPIADAQSAITHFVAVKHNITERKQTELALRASEDKWRRFSQDATMGIVVCDEQGNVIEWNPAQERITEISRADALGHSLIETQFQLALPERRTPERKAATLASMAEFLRTGQAPWASVPVYSEIQTASGKRCTIETIVFPIPTSQGFMAGAMVNDVTAQKQAERQLREHERLIQYQNQAFVTLARNENLYKGDLHSALQSITEAIARALIVERVSVWFYQPDRSGIRCADLFELSANRHSESIELYAKDFPKYFAGLQTETAIAADDAHTHPFTAEFSAAYLTPLGIRSMLDVPIHLAGQCVGVVCCEQVGSPRQWMTEEQNFGTAMAGMISTVLETDERLRAEQALRQANAKLSARLHELDMLNRIGLAVSSGLDVDQVLQNLYDLWQQIIKTDRFYIALYDAGTGLIEFPLFYHDGKPVVRPPRFIQTDPAFTGYVISSQKTLYLPDSFDPTTSPTGAPTHVEDKPTRSYVGVPLIVRNKVIGVISMQSYKVNAYTPQHVALFETVATQAAIAIENAKLYTHARRAQQDAEAANQAKSVFLANMSHELRTPLNAVLGFTQLMVNDENLTTSQRENLGIMGRSGEHLLALINDVLEISKIESGRVELHAEKFDLYHLLRGLEEMFDLRAQQKGLSLDFETDQNVPQYICADEGKLRQVLINLLGNAVKFTQQGGVTLRIKGTRQPENGLSSSSPVTASWKILFQVQDTGVGIAAEEIHTLFAPFVQTASGRKAGEGTGLGLPISRQYVHMMGGELTVRSEVGQGSIFSFELPVIEVTPSEFQTVNSSHRPVLGLAPDQHAPEGGPFRILVVEDIESSRKLMLEILHAWRPVSDSTEVMEIREVENGQAAVEMWEQWKPHLIWMDIRMPVLDGYEATRRIRARVQAQGLPSPIIVALTAGAFEEERERILAEGCDDFVRKPFHQDEISAVLAKHLGLRFAYQAAESQDKENGDSSLRSNMDALRLEIQKLDPTWQSGMRQAVIQGDVNWTRNLAQQIQETAPQLAAQLLEWINAFEVQKILRLLETDTGGL